MSEALFPVETYVSQDFLAKTENYKQRLKDRQVILDILGVKIDRVDQLAHPLLRVTVASDSPVYEYGHTLKSRRTNYYEDDTANFMYWSLATVDRGGMIEGRLEVVATLDDTDSTPILHLLWNSTDIILSEAVRLDDITEIAVFDENAAEVLLAYHAAEVDGSTHSFQHFNNLPTDVTFTDEELEPYVTSYWPEPKVIYTRPTS